MSYFRPHPGETRKINIEKTSKLVGFQIEMGPSGGIFVSSVNENSLAAQAGLVIGDQLLEVSLTLLTLVTTTTFVPKDVAIKMNLLL